MHFPTLLLTWVLWQEPGIFTLHGAVGTTEAPLPPYWTYVDTYRTKGQCEAERTERHAQQAIDFQRIMQRLHEHERLSEAVDRVVIYTWYCVSEEAQK